MRILLEYKYFPFRHVKYPKKYIKYTSDNEIYIYLEGVSRDTVILSYDGIL